MTVCFFGNYIMGYPRIEVLKKGFLQNGIRILECHTSKRGFLKYLELYQKHSKIKERYDILLVGMGSYSVVWLARLLTGKKLIFDAFVSLYLTEIYDRETIKLHSFRAWYLRFLEKLSFRLSELVLFDTQAQIDYVCAAYHLPQEKFLRVFVGADEEIFQPDSKYNIISPSKFIVHWHGHIAPFHGVETIIEAAKILQNREDVEFQIVTRFNSKFEKMKKLAYGLQNIRFYPETDQRGISVFLKQASIALGVFGNNLKARLVIPNKIFEAAASAKLVITGRQKALGELFEDQKSIIMVNPQDPQDLAEKIVQVKDHPEILYSFGQAAYGIYREKLTPRTLVKNLLDVLF